MVSLLKEYFPDGLVKELKKAVTIKPKVGSTDDILLALASDGCLSIIVIDAIDNEIPPKIIRQFKHVHDILPIESISGYPITYIVFNNSSVYMLDRDDLPRRETVPEDTICIQQHGLTSMYVTRGGQLWIDGKLQDIKDIVSTTITDKHSYYLLTDGTVKHKDPSNIVNLTDNILKLVTNDKDSLAITIDNKLIDLQTLTITDSNIVDAAIDHEFIVKLYSSGKLELSNFEFPSIKLEGIPDIIVMNHDTAFHILSVITIDGRVLVGRTYTTGCTFQTVPRLRLINDDNINTRANVRLQ